jgi:hypothetical protein
MRDSEGVEHSVEVTADSLYEAIALGLKAIRQSSWVEDVAQNFEVRVLVREVVLLHRDSFAADYQHDEYVLLGMAIKYAGLYGKEVRIIGTNRQTLDEYRKTELLQ